MAICAGIDEAGYGPMFGPLLIGRTIFSVPDPEADLWDLLHEAVCRNLSRRRGRIAVNDSKKLKTPAAGIKHLELGCLAFAAIAGHRPSRVDQWLNVLGEHEHHDLTQLPWYAPSSEQPWGELPTATTAGEIAVARAMLSGVANKAALGVADLGAAVVFEDRFNRLVSATRSKAATSFTFVAGHLQHIWQQFGDQHPLVFIDRQSGRTHYRELLAMNFPDARLIELERSPKSCIYRLEKSPRQMEIRFEVNADSLHMPVALASMIAKYTRELLMARFNAFFKQRLPDVRPTAGYAMDAKRWLADVEDHLPRLGIQPQCLCRRA